MKVLIKTVQWKAFGLKVQEQKPSRLFCCGRTLYLPERLMCGGLFFLFFWLHWVFIAALGLSLVAVSGATLRCGAQASHCSGFSCCGARALGVWASVVVARGL